MAGQDQGNKVIFVIDELDRCRPDYALELLEVIKHFFSVSRVHFVFGVNLEALKEMVRTRYGKEIDATTYLQKFIQVTLELPDEVEDQGRDVNLYLSWLCEEMNIPKYIGNRLKWQVKMVARANPISLRHIERIVSAVSLASRDVLEKEIIKPGMYGIMNDLIISKVVRPDFYHKFLEATITDSELNSYLKENFMG